MSFLSRKTARCEVGKVAAVGFVLIVLLMAGSYTLGVYVEWEATRAREDNDEDEEDVVFFVRK